MKVTSLVKTIQIQLLSMGRMKIWSWGAHAWTKIDENTLQFKVQGHHFKGHVRIEYIVGYDLYSIHFGHWKNNRWNNLETIEDVFFDQMLDLIDLRVEYIAEYNDR